MRRLEKNIKKFEKFNRDYVEYTRFKKRLEAEFEDQQGDEAVRGFQREQNEMRFTYDFVQNLISISQTIDIDIFRKKRVSPEVEVLQGSKPAFDMSGLQADLKEYDDFKDQFLNLLGQLEKEIFEKQTSQAIKDIQTDGLFKKF